MSSSELTFAFITNIIKAQNEVLLEEIAKQYKKSGFLLKEKYLTPEYYLPIIRNTKAPTKPDSASLA